MRPQSARPLGITLLVIVQILGGVAVLAVTTSSIAIPLPRGVPFQINGVARIMLAFGALLAFVVAYGLWSGRSWAWVLTLILAGINFLVALLGIVGGLRAAVVGVILNGVVIYYLLRPNVRVFFGRAPKMMVRQAQSPPLTTQQLGATQFCMECGARLVTGANYCQRCGRSLL